MKAIETYGPVAGRILIALIFVLSGFSKITGFEGTVGYIASKGLPLPQLGAVAAIVVELGGGLMLMVGWKARWAALAMAVFTAAAAVLFHNYWAAPAEMAQNQFIHFMKNISMVGGLLFVAAHGSGALSLERRAA
ncbi:MAG: DoxX family protein [Rhodocyclaceae bacterium]|nr:DoxX family protein [Rhodocyclaceae bacterium]MBX3669644.1 DoxX family protein [Rhodocyclaceae bacterium]